MSTPTLVRTMRSSSAMARPGAVKSPALPSPAGRGWRVARGEGAFAPGPALTPSPSPRGREGSRYAGDRGRLERRLGHGELDALGVQTPLVFLADEAVLFVVQDGPTALVDPEQVARLDLVVAFVGDAPARVRSAPVVDHSQRVLANAKVLVEPHPTAWRRRHQSTRDVLEHTHLVPFAAIPRRRAEVNRPVVRVALAPKTHQHRP